MKKKNVKNTVIAVGLVSALGVAGVSAYFTATDEATNNFTVKGIDVELTEPNWVDNPDITPNETIKKDPTVKNTGTEDQYVFMAVKVPYDNIITAQADGTRNPAADTELFTMNNLNPAWVEIETNKDTANKVVEHVFAYATGTATNATLTTFPVGSTSTLFESVTVCNAIEGQTFHGAPLENSHHTIDVDVYAIQEDDIKVSGNGTKNAAEVLAVYRAQNQ